jgi:MFS transporter, DHA1 family, inner membrane transport protein
MTKETGKAPAPTNVSADERTIQTDSRSQSPYSLAAGMLIGTAVLMILGIQPLLLGGLTQEGRLTDAQLGQVATVEVLMLALGAALGPRLMNQGAMRLYTSVACLLLALVDALVFVMHSEWILVASRATAGLLEGLALASVIVVLTHSRHPDRINGVFLAVQTIPQAVAAYLLPVTILPRGGANAGFFLLAGWAILAALGATGLVDRVQAQETKSSLHVIWSRPVIITYTAIVFQYAGINGAWNYVELLADQKRFQASSIGTAVAGLLCFQVLGAALVAWRGRRLPFRATLIIGSLVQSLLTVALVRLSGPGTFVAVACAFGLLWLALQPFQIRQLIHLDNTRQAALYLVPLCLAGMSAGPFAVSLFVNPGDVRGAFWSATALIGVSTALYCFASFEVDHRTERF